MDPVYEKIIELRAIRPISLAMRSVLDNLENEVVIKHESVIIASVIDLIKMYDHRIAELKREATPDNYATDLLPFEIEKAKRLSKAFNILVKLHEENLCNRREI